MIFIISGIIILALFIWLIIFEELSPDFTNCEKCDALVEVKWYAGRYDCGDCGHTKILEENP